MATIEEIAKMAGVSRGTVDRVLHERGKVAKEKEELIRKIAEELGYRPNIAGRGLSIRKKNLRILFLRPDSSHGHFYEKVEEGVLSYEKTLEPFNVEVRHVRRMDWYVGFDGGRILNLLKKERFDGVVLDGILWKTNAQVIRYLEEQGIPYVAYNCTVPREKVLAYVGCSYEKAGRIACRLAAFGRTGEIRVGIASYDFGNIESSQLRIKAFLEEAEKYDGMQIVFSHFLVPSHDFREFERQLIRQISTKAVDVLYLVNPGDYRICNTIHARWPALSIITNDLPEEEQRQMLKDGVITATITQEPEMQGRKALELLFQYLAFDQKPEKDRYETKLDILLDVNC